MIPLTAEQAQQIEEALDELRYANNTDIAKTKYYKALSIIRAARAQEQAEPKCNPHPDAPHGFDRNASHSENRYVCECDGWEPEQAEQEPVCKRCNGTKIVPDGKMYSVDGFQLEVPIECVKDCPDCAAPQPVQQQPECKYKEAYIIWQDKTEWVQETAHPKELGMHRADVLRQRIENLQNAAPQPVQQEPDILSKSLKRIQSLERQLKIAQQQWDNSCEYALELAERLFKYEGGSPMILNAEQAEQEPVGVVEGSGEWGIAGVLVAGVPIGTKLYAAPVRTKDLTDDEVHELVLTWENHALVRAAIAAYKEKNK